MDRAGCTNTFFDLPLQKREIMEGENKQYTLFKCVQQYYSLSDKRFTVSDKV